MFVFFSLQELVEKTQDADFARAQFNKVRITFFKRNDALNLNYFHLN